jgi:two-component system chemotaxis response regulator CheB
MRARASQPIVLIGVSTGGPAALGSVLPALPADLEAPVFIVQHMPPLFTAPLADSLAGKCAIRVKEAADGETAHRGCAYIAPGGRQMKLARGPAGEVVVRITDDPPENNCRPAVDCLFRSAALHFPGRSVAAILTGMGNDGTEGLRSLKRGGCLAIAQDEASSVVFGMPREAIQAGVVDIVAPLSGIAAAIMRGVREADA